MAFAVIYCAIKRNDAIADETTAIAYKDAMDGRDTSVKESGYRGERGAKLMLASAMFIFGTIGIFRRYIPLPSSLIALVRGLIGTLFLLVLMGCKQKRLDRAAIAKNLRILSLSGAFIGFNWILLFEAYRYTSVATATLCYYMAPIFVILASPFLLRERLTAWKAVCAAVAFAGMVLVSGVMEIGIANISELRGVLFGLGAALLYACVVILNKKLDDVSAFDRTVCQLGAAAIVLLPYTCLTEDFSRLSISFVTALLLLVVGVFNTGVAYTLYFGSMKGLKAQTVALFSYIDPVVAILLSALLLKERMGPLSIVGAVLVLGATFLGEAAEHRGKAGSAGSDASPQSPSERETPDAPRARRSGQDEPGASERSE